MKVSLRVWTGKHSYHKLPDVHVSLNPKDYMLVYHIWYHLDVVWLIFDVAKIKWQTDGACWQHPPKAFRRRSKNDSNAHAFIWHVANDGKLSWGLE